MKREIKVWGERWRIRADSTHETSYLKVKANHRCSWHKHQEKYNLFVVVRGHIAIVTGEGEILLGPGESAQVRPGVNHEFRAIEDSEMIEEMFVAYDEQDIERFRPGGLAEGILDKTE